MPRISDELRKTPYCMRCKTRKSIALFTERKRICDPCLATRGDEVRERKLRQLRRWQQKNPERMSYLTLKSRLKCHYGITIEDYEEMLRRQRGRCAICGTDKPTGQGSKTGRFSVDHDHETGKVRGLLCGRCNTGLGFFKEQPNNLIAAFAYLMDSRELREVDAASSIGWSLADVMCYLLDDFADQVEKRAVA